MLGVPNFQERGAHVYLTKDVTAKVGSLLEVHDLDQHGVWPVEYDNELTDQELRAWHKARLIISEKPLR